jgi:hypothetical protein
MEGKRQTVEDLRKKAVDMTKITEELRECVDTLDFDGARKRTAWLVLRAAEFDEVATFVERDLRTAAMEAMKRINAEKDPATKVDILNDFLRSEVSI